MSPSTHEDFVCKSERPSAKDKGKGKAIEVESEAENEKSSEEESYEIEEEIADIKRLIKLSKDAKKLDEKLPESEKDKNAHLNDLRKEPHVKDFFGEEVPGVEDLNELEYAL
jgi:DNA-binding transcriptional regulator GbsR (MarR family)